YSKDKKATELLNTIKTNYEGHEIISHAVAESLKKDDSQLDQLKKRISARSLGARLSITKGYDAYKQLCITCHGADLKGIATEDGGLIAPPLIGSERVMGDKGTLSKILLNGLIGPIEGKEYGIMMPLKDNSDEWIANVLSYVRAMNDADNVDRKVVRNARRDSGDREDYWTLEELYKIEAKRKK
ncbi:cytochrome c, partial [Algibacter sp.]|nr:cytochrome c [Algibacter sp.]